MNKQNHRRYECHPFYERASRDKEKNINSVDLKLGVCVAVELRFLEFWVKWLLKTRGTRNPIWEKYFSY